MNLSCPFIHGAKWMNDEWETTAPNPPSLRFGETGRRIDAVGEQRDWQLDQLPDQSGGHLRHRQFQHPVVRRVDRGDG